MRKANVPVVLCIALMTSACPARGQEFPASPTKSAAHEPTPDASNIYQVGGAISAPRLIHQVEAEYSDLARRKKISAHCTVSMVVDTEGHVTDARIMHSAAGNQPARLQAAAATLDDKAIEAVQQYVFEPSTLHGKPVSVHVNVEVSFHIFR